MRDEPSDRDAGPPNDRATRLEHTDEGLVLVKGGHRVPLIGTTAHIIGAWYDHMLKDHGPKDAATYLAGVIHGMQHANDANLRRTLARIESRRLDLEADPVMRRLRERAEERDAEQRRSEDRSPHAER